MADATLPRSDFYVYVMFRPDGSPCYVGKGRGKRIENLKARGSHLRNIIEKYGGLLTIKVRAGLTESESFAVEIALIAAIGRKISGGPLVNETDGGEGASGCFQSPEKLAKLREASLGKKHTAETRAKLSKISTNMTVEHRAKLRAATLGKPRSAESIAKTVKGNLGRKRSLEFRAKMRAIHLGKNRSTEAREKMSAAKRGKPLSEAFIAGARAAIVGRPVSETTRAKMRSAQIGKIISGESRAKMSAAQRLRHARHARNRQRRTDELKG